MSLVFDDFVNVALGLLAALVLILFIEVIRKKSPDDENHPRI
jgi:hypothetical protein